MAVIVNEVNMTRKQALVWIAERGIERLPKIDEVLQYIPPCSYNQYDLQRTGAEFRLTSNVLAD